MPINAKPLALLTIVLFISIKVSRVDIYKVLLRWKSISHAPIYLNCMVGGNTATEQTHEGPQSSTHHEAHPGLEGAALNDSLHV